MRKARHSRIQKRSLALLLGVAFLAAITTPAVAVVLDTTDGFYGIWYDNQANIGTGLYGPKYGGGLGTYPQQTSPIAIYSETEDKTFFLYGGVSNPSNNTLKNYISYYDHQTGMVARPREVRHVGGNDVHRNATLSIDDAGHVWVFGHSHGGSGTGNVFKSTSPNDITEFDEIPLPNSIFNNGGDNELSYNNPLYVPGEGFVLLFNKYSDGRAVHAITSTDGVNWVSGSTGLAESDRLMKFDSGHYAFARREGSKIGVVANTHPGGLNHRTNLFYYETNDFAATWDTIDGTAITSTITSSTTPALVHDYHAEDRLVYLKDLNYDSSGNPIILYLTVSDETNTGHYSGPQPGGRTVHVAHWTGSEWDINDVTTTDHNYDHGELYVEDDGTWQVIAPFLEGPQQWGTGGAIGIWESEDQGENWSMVQQLTPDTSVYNHTYVRRPVNADDDFYAFWADGDAMQNSDSRLYFSNKDGLVSILPVDFDGEFAEPTIAPLVRSDLNHDNMVTAADWLIFIANDLTDITSLTAAQRYDAGDLNGDKLIDAFDFRIFKEDFELHNGGLGSFAAMLNSVPEPSSVVLLAMAFCPLLARRNRRARRRG